MEISLWEGNLDVFLGEPPMYFGEDVVPRRETQIEAGQEKSYLQLKGAIGEKFEERGWLRFLQHVRVTAADLSQDFACLGGVCAVSDAHLDDHPIGRIGKCPVEEPTCDEVFVRNYQFLLVEIHHGGCSHSNPRYCSGGVSNGDHVPNAHRLLEQQDQA